MGDRRPRRRGRGAKPQKRKGPSGKRHRFIKESRKKKEKRDETKWD